MTALEKALETAGANIAALLTENAADITDAVQAAIIKDESDKSPKVRLSIAVVLVPMGDICDVRTRLSWTAKEVREVDITVHADGAEAPQAKEA